MQTTLQQVATQASWMAQLSMSIDLVLDKLQADDSPRHWSFVELVVPETGTVVPSELSKV